MIKFDIYGRYQLAVERTQGKWIIFRSEGGKKRLEFDIIIPSDVSEADVPACLEDLLHEYALPGRAITRIK